MRSSGRLWRSQLACPRQQPKDSRRNESNAGTKCTTHTKSCECLRFCLLSCFIFLFCFSGSLWDGAKLACEVPIAVGWSEFRGRTVFRVLVMMNLYKIIKVLCCYPMGF